jgi:hypothetical protein
VFAQRLAAEELLADAAGNLELRVVIQWQLVERLVEQKLRVRSRTGNHRSSLPLFISLSFLT